MAQDMTEKELLKMELDQLKKEVKNERQMVSIAPECKTGSNLGTLRMLMGHTLQIHVRLRERLTWTWRQMISNRAALQ